MWSGASPEVQHPGKACGKKRRKSLGRDLLAESRGLPLGELGRAREVYTEADGDAITVSFEQDPGELPAAESQIIRPLEHQRLTRSGRVVFYDYDEICLLTDVEFRELPAPSDDDDDLRAEPSFYVGPRDGPIELDGGDGGADVVGVQYRPQPVSTA